jgi:DNA-binding GntR family transcriptional regulator
MAERDRVQRSFVDHSEIIKAIESRQPELAERLVREHTMSLHAHVARTWA